jgi:CBS domain-containing protein
LHGRAAPGLIDVAQAGQGGLPLGFCNNRHKEKPEEAMRADDVMTMEVITVSPDTHIRDVAKILLDNHVSALPVVDDKGQLLGIVSEGDLMRRRESGTERRQSWWLRLIENPNDLAEEYVKSHGLHARDVMTKKVITVAEDTPVGDIAELLEKHRIKRVPVVHGGRVVGIVSRANLLHGLIVRKAPAPAAGGDVDLRKAVLDELRESGVRSLIDVVVHDGVVHLWGAVESDAEKEALEVAAEGTSGVSSVVNHVGVYPQIGGRTTMRGV